MKINTVLALLIAAALADDDDDEEPEKTSVDVVGADGLSMTLEYYIGVDPE